MALKSKSYSDERSVCNNDAQWSTINYSSNADRKLPTIFSKEADTTTKAICIVSWNTASPTIDQFWKTQLKEVLLTNLMS